MKVPCVIKAVYIPEVGIFCRRCYLDDWSGAIEFITAPLAAHVSGFCDEPDQALRLFGSHLDKDPFHIRRLWTHNGTPMWISELFYDLGYGPYDRRFPVQPLTSSELEHWTEACWTCEQSWLTDAVVRNEPIPNSPQDVSVARSSAEHCLGCSLHNFDDLNCEGCGLPLR